MRKTLLALLIHLLFAGFSFAQIDKAAFPLSKLQEPQPHYLPEFTFDSSTDTARWLSEKHGLQVSFASTDRHFFRTEPPLLPQSASWQATGWKGERLNTLILVWSPDTLQQVRFVTHTLVNGQGQALDKNQLNLSLVRYVVSNYPYNAKDATCDVSPYKKAWLMPDRLEPFEQFNLPGRTVRPVWLSLEIPKAAAPGIYKANIEARSKGHSVVLQVAIKVQDHELPAPHEWKYRLDLWQNPWVVAWYNHVQPWSPEHKMLLKKHLALYAAAGGKYITTYAVHSPWADNSYMIEETMIDWIKRKDSSWKFDYHIFDEYVQLAMDAGIDKAITIYTPIPWGNRFRYKDEATGDYIYTEWVPGTAPFKNAWNAFLTDLKAHLQSKGWLSKTYLGINENTLDQTLATIKVMREHSKDWKITYAGNWHKELDTLLNDYCCVYSKEPGLDEVRTRAARGFTSTFYICCTPPKPNDFIFSPPIEGRWLSWYASAHHYDGFLRWAYDAWPADPTRDARHAIWPAGDCFLVYPGGNSSVRFEKLREGIVDYEKIDILRARTTGAKGKALLAELDRLLQSFLTEHEFDTEKITADVDKGKKILEELSEL